MEDHGQRPPLQSKSHPLPSEASYVASGPGLDADGRDFAAPPLPRERLKLREPRCAAAPLGETPAVMARASLAGAAGDRELLARLRDFPVPSSATLRRVFDLTPAEARLAQSLAGGDSLEDVAEALDIKMSTARTQLAAIFGKTGTCRQAQLVAILSRLAHIG